MVHPENVKWDDFVIPAHTYLRTIYLDFCLRYPQYKIVDY